MWCPVMPQCAASDLVGCPGRKAAGCQAGSQQLLFSWTGWVVLLAHHTQVAGRSFKGVTLCRLMAVRYCTRRIYARVCQAYTSVCCVCTTRLVLVGMSPVLLGQVCLVLLHGVPEWWLARLMPFWSRLEWCAMASLHKGSALGAMRLFYRQDAQVTLCGLQGLL
jgi:hypothetical protein